MTIGAVLAGKYEIKRLLGRGGMGSVYEGLHVEIGKRVAIKVIDPQFAGSEEIQARFRREARAASAVESDAIVQVFDVGQDPAVGLYMVMEFLTGEDLAVRLEREGRLEPGAVVAIGLQAARALAKAHAAGVVHRDLKPANLFLCATDDGSVKLKILDFGISKLARADGASTAPGAKPLTRTGTVMGTPQYMSPEQAQGLDVDLRSDVWSLGAVLYEALAGKPPFPEMATYEQTIISIVTTRPKPLSEVAPGLPANVCEAVDRALAREAKDRWPSCAELATCLGARASGASLSHVVVPVSSRVADPSSPTVAAPTPPEVRVAPVTTAGVTLAAGVPRSRAPLFALGGVLVVASVIVGVVFARQSGSQSVASSPSGPVAASSSASLASLQPTQTFAPIASAVVLPPITATDAGAVVSTHSATQPTARPSAAAPHSASSQPSQFGGLGHLDDDYK